jgi:GAF domain-containing protein
MRLLTPHDSDLADSMNRAGTELVEVAPSALAFSLAVVADGITLTYVTSEPSARLLDAVQYFGGGPCEDAVGKGEPLEFGVSDPLDEQSWGLFAQASASYGVHSTLSLPILRDGDVIAGVNLYGGAPDTFTDRHEAVAGIFGAWAPGAVSNADLSFSTRLEAVRAPGRIEDMTLVEMAVGIFVARYSLPPAKAREKLTNAAARAGIPLQALARLVVDHLEQLDA